MVRGYSTGVGEGSPPANTATAHRITAIRVSGTCQAKSPLKPLCANDQLVSMGVDPNGVSVERVGAERMRGDRAQAAEGGVLRSSPTTRRTAMLFYARPRRPRSASRSRTRRSRRRSSVSHSSPARARARRRASFTARRPAEARATRKGRRRRAVPGLGAEQRMTLLKPLRRTPGEPRRRPCGTPTRNSAPPPSRTTTGVPSSCSATAAFDQATCGQTPRSARRLRRRRRTRSRRTFSCSRATCRTRTTSVVPAGLERAGGARAAPSTSTTRAEQGRRAGRVPGRRERSRDVRLRRDSAADPSGCRRAR